MIDPRKPEYQEWLAGLKPGDQFAHEVSIGGLSRRTTYSVHVVDRLTTTQIIAGALRVHRKNGVPVGARYFDNIEPLSEPVIQKIADERDHSWWTSFMSRRDTPSLAQIRAIRKALEDTP